MKTQFKQWLINQNSTFINECGIDCILAKLDDELSILNANKYEYETLQEWLEMFYETLDKSEC